MAFIVNPIGDFPLIDDWQYARPVAYLINTGRYFSPDSYSPILIAQVYWGALFCLPGGFSHTTLRISVLVLGLLGIIGFYFLVNLITSNKKVSFIGALILLTNPLYIVSSNSFMTDVPFLAFVIFSVLFFSKSLQTDTFWFLVVGTIFAIIATLIRQFCIAIPFAYAIASIIKHKPGIRHSFKYFIPAILAIIAYNCGLIWLKHIGSELRPYAGHTVAGFLSNPGTIAAQVFERTGHILYYPAFFLFPLLICNIKRVYSSLSSKQKKAVLAFPLIFIMSLLSTWHQLPYGPIIHDWSIGVKTLRTGNIMTPDLEFDIKQITINSIGFIGAILLLMNIGSILVKLINSFKTGSLNVISAYQIFILAGISGYALLLFIPVFFFDRYTLLFIPFFLLLILSDWSPASILRPYKLVFSGVFIFLITYFSVTATHDYLAWNRSRWQALHYLTTDLKISSHKIDGGSEYAGWINEPFYPNQQNTAVTNDDEYIVTFNNLDGYVIMKQFPYQNYFPYETRNIYILHRK